MISPKGSFDGFKLSKNFWSAIKKTLYVLVPAVLTELVSNNLIAAGVASVIGPMALNALEFWLSDVKID
jgi:hypothetical protein